MAFSKNSKLSWIAAELGGAAGRHPYKNTKNSARLSVAVDWCETMTEGALWSAPSDDPGLILMHARSDHHCWS